MDDILFKSVSELLERADAGNRITIGECESLLKEVPAFTEDHTIEDTREFLNFLGCPGEDVKIIHVAGTNGKGSVCNYISSVLTAADYTVGMFTSPHLVSVNERFAVDGKPITEGVFAEIFVEALRRVMEYEPESYFPNNSEFLFIAAMILYDVYPVDYLVLETGMGGRLDATNVISKPELSVITEIGLDHMKYLGDSVEAIAGEKAGIIKSGVPVVFFDKREEATEVLKKKALELDSRAICVESRNIEDVRTVRDDAGNKYIAFSYNSLYDRYVDLKLSTEAVYQTENAAIAISCLEVLRENGANITELDIREGLMSARWEGRMDEVHPGMYVDGAHNVDGIDAFIESVKGIECEGRKMLLFGVVEDKQYRDIIRRLLVCGEFDSVFVSVLETQRSVSLSELKAAFEDSKEELGIIGLPIKYYSNVRDAITDIIAVRKSGDMVFAAGSLYLVGQFKSIM